MVQITGDGACDSSGVTHVLDAGDVPDGLGVHEVFDEPKYQPGYLNIAIRGWGYWMDISDIYLHMEIEPINYAKYKI